MAKKTNVGIIGLGYVGSALHYWFRKNKKKLNIFLYDKYKHIGSLEEVNKADIIFIAVPTPFHENGRGYDDSAVWESVKNIENGKIIVIKSTILPGSTDSLQKKYPKKILLFNPEFLTAKNPIKDFLLSSRQIVGYTNQKSKKVAKKILSILPGAPYTKVMKSREAELVKYFSNTFLAAKVIFANQMYDLAKKVGGIDYNIVKDTVVQDKRIGNSHFDVFTDGYRGYGGLCLPKDTKSLIQLGRKLKARLTLLETIDKINIRLQKRYKR